MGRVYDGSLPWADFQRLESQGQLGLGPLREDTQALLRRLAQEMLDQLPKLDIVELKEALKSECARRRWRYDAGMIADALDGAIPRKAGRS